MDDLANSLGREHDATTQFILTLDRAFTTVCCAGCCERTPFLAIVGSDGGTRDRIDGRKSDPYDEPGNVLRFTHAGPTEIRDGALFVSMRGVLWATAPEPTVQKFDLSYDFELSSIPVTRR